MTDLNSSELSALHCLIYVTGALSADCEEDSLKQGFELLLPLSVQHPHFCLGSILHLHHLLT